MDTLVTIGALDFDAAHVALFIVGVLLVASLVWLRAKWRETALAAETQAFERGRELERLGLDLSTANDSAEMLRCKLQDAEKQLAAAAARGEAERKEFAAMAKQAIEGAHKSFLDRAEVTFQHQTKQANGNLEKLMQPIGKTFHEFKSRIEAIEKVRTEDKTVIQQQVLAITENLRRNTSETSKLVNALTAPRGGGRWGEMTLRNVMEQAGLSSYCDFSEQVADRTEDGIQRPDAVIRLPGDRQIVVDAKVSLDAYLAAADATDADQQAAYLKAHADAVKAQVERLASKGYQNNLNERVDFVAMFIPGENFFAAALQHMPDLLEKAYSRNVIVTTPSTLIGLAKTVAYVWRQENMTRNAMEAAELGAQLYERVQVLSTHIDKLGTTLNSAVGHYNKVNSSLDKRVYPTLRKFEDLSIAPPERDLPDLKQIETSASRTEVPPARKGKSEAA
ncbi:MAG: DNA recombination protein RmuC [Pseudomonadota bacterium]